MVGDLYSFEEGLASPSLPLVVGSAVRSDDLPSAGALPASSMKNQHAALESIGGRWMKRNSLSVPSLFPASNGSETLPLPCCPETGSWPDLSKAGVSLGSMESNQYQCFCRAASISLQVKLTRVLGSLAS